MPKTMSMHKFETVWIEYENTNNIEELSEAAQVFKNITRPKVLQCSVKLNKYNQS